MPHFFIKSTQIKDNKIYISKDENFNHIKNSLRVRQGEKLLFIDENYIQYETTVTLCDRESLVADISLQYKSKRFISKNIYLAQSVLKNEAQTSVIQKASELGVKGIYPLITDNCVIKEKVISQKIPHWQKISYEASKQCERPDIAKIYDIKDFNFVFDNDFDFVFIFVEKNSNTTLKTISHTKTILPQDKILVVTGPEGGFSEMEFEKMYNHSASMLTLGNLILRADTAVIVAVANILHEFG